MSHNEPGYFGTIWRAAKSIIDGMAVTASYAIRPPITVQYPDRTPLPVPDTLPERYRGFLEVDMETCGACLACQRECPIDCIKIDMIKERGVDGKPRLVMTRFDIDLGKCMYCGLCTEACGTDVLCQGDTEPTKAIRFTREFEGVVDHLPQTTFRFIRPGDKVVAAKAQKGVVIPSRPRGEIAREVRRVAQVYNALAFAWALAHKDDPKPEPAKPDVKAEPAAAAKAEAPKAPEPEKK
ncbi:MAG TPA: 4Fe-4S dicluster domain-containing protein [Polyangia bacterium]|jgi:formate hydrogenlyase subunit 6/NADH:ubiquinone oxidoreductase subunit I